MNLITPQQCLGKLESLQSLKNYHLKTDTHEFQKKLLARKSIFDNSHYSFVCLFVFSLALSILTVSSAEQFLKKMLKLAEYIE